MTRTRLKTLDITPALVQQCLETFPKPEFTARDLTEFVCAQLRRPARDADRAYVSKALRALEASGHARITGEQPAPNKIGRNSRLWAAVAQPDLPAEAPAT